MVLITKIVQFFEQNVIACWLLKVFNPSEFNISSETAINVELYFNTSGNIRFRGLFHNTARYIKLCKLSESDWKPVEKLMKKTLVKSLCLLRKKYVLNLFLNPSTPFAT